jgi:hypothetical protein
MVVFSKNLASGCPRNDDPFLGRPTGSRFFRSVGLARSAALRSPEGGALRAKRRARPTTAAVSWPLAPGSLLRLRTGRFMPRMVCRRRPLPFLYRNRHTWARLAGRCIESLRLYWRGDFPPAQRTPPRLDAHPAVPPLAYPHFAPRGHDVPALRFQLEKAVVVTHHPIVTKDPLQFRRARCLTAISANIAFSPSESSGRPLI